MTAPSRLAGRPADARHRLLRRRAVGLALIACGRAGRDTELPFGVFLSAAALVVLFFAPELLHLLAGCGHEHGAALAPLP